MDYPIKVKSPLFLAPMAGVTNVAFRILCKRMGAGLCYTEFLSADALVRYTELVERTGFDVAKEERPVVTQIFGENEKTILEAGEFLEGKTDVIDLNIGCPAPKIMACGGGSALLRNPKQIQSILEALRTLKTPISCKIRLGIDDKHIVANQVARIAERIGCCAIAIHPRTQKQKYMGKADWSYIKKIKDSVSIPVIGNGDVITHLDAERMFKETNCDFVMVGRAAMRDPFFFKKTNRYLKTRELLDDISVEEKIDLLKQYIELLQKYNIYNDVIVKQAVMQFTKGYKGSRELRGSITQLKNKERIMEKLDEFLSISV